MSRKFDEQAELYHVYPLHNASDGFPNSAKIAAAGFEARAGVWRFTGSTTHVPPVSAPPVLSRDFQMKADLDFSHDDVSGTMEILLTVNEGSDTSNPSRHFRVMISSIDHVEPASWDRTVASPRDRCRA